MDDVHQCCMKGKYDIIIIEIHLTYPYSKLLRSLFEAALVNGNM